MSFTSFSFLILFSLTFILYYVLSIRYRWICLLFASIVFYMWVKPIFILIPIVLIVSTYYGGLQIEKSISQRRKKNLFILTIVLQIGILIFFKYFNFFTSSVFSFISLIKESLFGSDILIKNPLLLNLFVPLGISYITFQTLGYLIEIYRGNYAAEKNFGHFSTYVFFFPKLLMGPVERAHHFLPQLKTGKPFNYDAVTDGLKLIIWGLVKKIVIADQIGIFVDSMFSNLQDSSSVGLIIACICYTIQMYADFSGYTDMAIGLSKMLGFDIAENFNRPFSAKSISEFWRRWHISLSSWFADYFYNPLAIAKRDLGAWGIFYASMLTFLILGLWHGANWTYLVFGGLQGLVIAIEYITRNRRKKIRKRIPIALNNILGISFTFMFFTFSLIFFRAKNVSEALTVIKQIVGFDIKNFSWTSIINTYKYLIILLPILLTIESIGFSKIIAWINRKPIYFRWSFYLAIVLTMCIFGIYQNKQFIYTQF